MLMALMNYHDIVMYGFMILELDMSVVNRYLLYFIFINCSCLVAISRTCKLYSSRRDVWVCPLPHSSFSREETL